MPEVLRGETLVQTSTSKCMGLNLKEGRQIMAPSNTKDAFREIIGRRIVGLLFDELPVGRCDLSAGTKTLVFEDGTGFTIASNGSFWQESADEIAHGLAVAKSNLDMAKREIDDALATAGALGIEE